MKELGGKVAYIVMLLERQFLSRLSPELSGSFFLTAVTLLFSEGQEAEFSGSQLGNASERSPVTASV